VRVYTKKKGGGMNKLSEELEYLGFFLVHDTLEKVGDQNRVIRSGTPFTYGVKNGILAIYDELGYPWIIKEDIFPVMVSIKN
jgi:hypothetical protein